MYKRHPTTPEIIIRHLMKNFKNFYSLLNSMIVEVNFESIEIFDSLDVTE